MPKYLPAGKKGAKLKSEEIVDPEILKQLRDKR